MKYKVGDKVRIKPKAELKKCENVIPTMLQMADKIATIRLYDEDISSYKIVEFAYWWNDDNFVGLAEEQPEFIVIPKITKLLLVEDGSVDEDDIDKLADLGIRVLIYRQGAIKPELIDLEK